MNDFIADTERRLIDLQTRLDDYDVLVHKLIKVARMTKGGRLALMAVGIE